MMADSGVKITLDNFPALTAEIVQGVGQGVRALAFAVQEQAIENIREVDAIDTGALRNSIYVETSEANERATALASAVAAGKTVGKKSGKAGAVAAADPGEGLLGDGLTVRVASCVEHGAYVEMGVTASAYGDQPPRPFLHPAAAAIQPKAQGVVAQYVADAVAGAAS